MELALVYLGAFLRPLLAIDLTFGGSTGEVSWVYDWVTVGLTVILAAAFLMNASLRRNVRFSGLDLAMAAFVTWCFAVYIIYFEKALGREMLKLVFPFFVYFIVKNVLKDREQYRKMIALMIAGFVIPVALSAVLVLQGEGQAYVSYWTGVARYQGAYSAVHNFGHNMTFVLMLIGVYVVVSRFGVENGEWVTRKRAEMMYLVALGLGALFCLLMSQTRTQLLGLLAFGAYTLFVFNRRAFFLAMVAVVTLGIILYPIMQRTILWDFNKVEAGVWSKQELAAGRPRIWENNLRIFANMPIDRELGGVGIGNKDIFGGTEGITDSHNDYLDVMIQTGVVGLVLYLLMQFLLLRKILDLSGKEKHVFVAMFIAVTGMNLSSNSYISRSAIAQLFFLAMTYVELRVPTKT